MLIGGRVALAVDFNLSIASFERDMQGVRHLVNFALSSPRNKICSIECVLIQDKVYPPEGPNGS